jgi:phosphocarrier protein HPr
MEEFRSTVASPVGLHARPASLFSRSAKESGCVVRLAKITEGVASDFVDGEIVVQVEGDTEVATAQ